MQFIEDMTSAEAAKAGMLAPAGLVNLGNTCYMNSTLQCVRSIPQLRDALAKEAALSRPGTDSARLVSALKALFSELDTSPVSVPPFGFWTILKALFPRFAETGPSGCVTVVGQGSSPVQGLCGLVVSKLLC